MSNFGQSEGRSEIRNALAQFQIGKKLKIQMSAETRRQVKIIKSVNERFQAHKAICKALAQFQIGKSKWQ